MPTTSLAANLEQVRWFRLRRSGLISPFTTPESAAQMLVGVQAQIHPAAGVALFNRTPDLTHIRYEQLLFDARSLVKLWGQRGTLHVYATTDWPLVCAMLADHKSWWGRTAERTDTLDAYSELVTRSEALLRAKGLMGRSDLRTSGLITNEEHLSPWGGVFSDLVRLGYACHAARDGEGIFAHRTFWRPDLAWAPPDVESANLEVLRRYVRTYGPATQQDFAYWRGAKAESTRRWLTAIANELMIVTVDGADMFLLQEDVDDLLAPTEELQRNVQMLYRFDPLLLAHKDKRWIVPAAHHKQVFRIAGHIEGVVLESGVAVATWRYARKSGGLFVSLEPFKRLSPRVRRAVEKQAQQLARFFALPLAEIDG